MAKKNTKAFETDLLNEIDKKAQRVRAFLQGIAYANGIHPDLDHAIENAWHYSDDARMISVLINQLRKD